MTVIDLPFPPSTNNLFVNGARGRFPSQKYDEWKQLAGWEIKRQRPSKCLGPVSLSFEFGLPDRRKRDITNLLKAPEDLLCSHGIIEADDHTVVRQVTAKWSDSITGMRVTILEVSKEAIDCPE